MDVVLLSHSVINGFDVNTVATTNKYDTMIVMIMMIGNKERDQNLREKQKK